MMFQDIVTYYGSNKLIISVFISFILMTLISCSKESTDKAGADNAKVKYTMVFPGSDWEVRTPESQGVDSAKLNKAMNYLGAKAGGVGVSEAVVIRNGYMIWRGSNIDAVHTIDSGTKTFTTTVLGLLIQDGKIALDTPLVKILPGLDDKYSTYAGITFRHVASMTSGYDGEKGEKMPGMTYGDPTKYLMPNKPLAALGTRYQYHDPAVHLMGYALTRVAGEPLKAIFERRIADQIGMKNWDWKITQVVGGITLNNPSGIYKGGIHVSAREMARYGFLYLNRGNWTGKQLIDSSWVDQATTNQVATSLSAPVFDARGHFGFMWWTNGINAKGKRAWSSAPPKTYTSKGASRNYCFVIPEWNMVIVRMDDSMGMSKADKIWNNFFKILGKGIS
jgi:CubicO group peptidase (beta-lactamase class C family)